MVWYLYRFAENSIDCQMFGFGWFDCERLSANLDWSNDHRNVQDIYYIVCMVWIFSSGRSDNQNTFYIASGTVFDSSHPVLENRIGNALYTCDARKNFFDIVIGNPPYVGHKGGQKEFFRDFQNTKLGQKYSQERMDLFYYFFHWAIQTTNQTGIISFLTTNYYPTVDSAVKLRKHITEETIPFLFVDCNEYELFSSAQGQHNLKHFVENTDMPEHQKN